MEFFPSIILLKIGNQLTHISFFNYFPSSRDEKTFVLLTFPFVRQWRYVSTATIGVCVHPGWATMLWLRRVGNFRRKNQEFDRDGKKNNIFQLVMTCNTENTYINRQEWTGLKWRKSGIFFMYCKLVLFFLLFRKTNVHT